MDVLAIGPHPDDVEVAVGGLIHKLAQHGYSVGIVDLTRGETASRGTVEERREEAQLAATILGVESRENAGLPDGSVANTPDQRLTVIEHIRAMQPAVLLAPFHTDRHPDHEAAHLLVRDAAYLAGLTQIDTAQEPFRPPRIYYYRVYGQDDAPNLVVDVSAHFEGKLEALRAYRSQFFNPDYNGPETYVASKSFWESITARAAYWGGRAGVQYGECLYSIGALGVDLPPGLEGVE